MIASRWAELGGVRSNSVTMEPFSVLAEVSEVAPQGAILAKTMADLPGHTRSALVLVFDAGLRERLRQRVLREAFAARDRQLPHVNEERSSQRDYFTL